MATIEIRPKKLKILVKTNVHDIVKVDALSSDTVKVLKYKISKAKALEKTEKFDLSFRGKHLKNDNALIDDLKIKDNSIVDFCLNHITGGFVFIKRQDNQQIISIEYRREDTIGIIKEKLSKLFSVPQEAQHLSAYISDLKKNEVSLKLLTNGLNAYDTCLKCRNQFFLTIEEKYLIKSPKSKYKFILLLLLIFTII